MTEHDNRTVIAAAVERMQPARSARVETRTAILRAVLGIACLGLLGVLFALLPRFSGGLCRQYVSRAQWDAGEPDGAGARADHRRPQPRALRKHPGDGQSDQATAGR